MSAQKVLAADTEGFPPRQQNEDRRTPNTPFAVSASDGKNLWYWEWRVNYKTRKVTIPSEELSEVISLFDSYDRIVFHNAGYDVSSLQSVEIDLTKRWGDIDDTILMSHVLESNSLTRHRLKELCKIHLDIDSSDEKELHAAVVSARRKIPLKWRGPAVESDYFLPREVFGPDGLSPNPRWERVLQKYSQRDAEREWMIYCHFIEGLRQRKAFALYERERKLLPVIYDLENRGMTFCVKTANRLSKKLKKELESLDLKVCSIAEKYGFSNFNCRSYPQKNALIYGKLNAPRVKRTSKGSQSIDVDALEKIQKLTEHKKGDLYDVVSLLRSYGKLKTRNGYLEGSGGYLTLGVPVKDDRTRRILYPSYNQVGTSTTRFSSSNPNGQNIEKVDESGLGLRSVFFPRKDSWWYCVDYSQLELRILAVLAKETSLIKCFRDNEDVHQLTADRCGISRSEAKNVNYATTYGGGTVRLEAMTGVKNFKSIFFNAYPQVEQFLRSSVEKARKDRFIETKFGYRLYVPSERPYASSNYCIQGTAGDVLKNAMIAVHGYLERLQGNPLPVFERKFRLIACIHDELIFEAPNVENKITKTILSGIKSCMERAGKELGILTPVDFSIVKDNWSNKEDYHVD